MKTFLKTVLPVASHLVVIVYGISTVYKLEAEYLQARRLYKQMEEDHGRLVKMVIEVNNLMAPSRNEEWLEQARKAAE